jgi:4-aminobutyrate aminotransferase/(S)-3-amino-2-methylpropionate transaminase
MITSAKGIAGGLPLAAVTGRAEIMDSIHAGGLGGTYGGNPVTCAAALGAIATIEGQNLVAAAQQIESVMMGRLHELAAEHPKIGEVRGRGAMIAIEIVTPGTIEPDAAETSRISNACHQAGLVTLTCGTYGNVLRFLPPLVMPQHLLTEGLDILAAALKA